MSSPYPTSRPNYLSSPNPLSDSPTIWFMKKYWWVGVPVALAFAGRLLERKRKHTLSAYRILEDFSSIAAPGLGVLGVIALIRQEHADAQIKQLEDDDLVTKATSVEGYYQ